MAVLQAKSISFRSAVSSRARRTAVRREAVRVEAHGAAERAQMAAASMAAAVLLVAQGADAGVLLEKPERKKAFQSDGTAPVKQVDLFIPKGVLRTATPKAAPAPKAKPAEIEFSSGGLDPRVLGLPASLGFVAGLAFVASKIDVEFDEFMSATLIKDNNIGQSGLGYEELIKRTYGGIYGAPSAGTKKVKAAAKKK